MNKIYISKDANKILIDYLTQLGYFPQFIASEGVVDPAISNHPDVFLCKMGAGDNSPLFFARSADLGKDYPEDSAFNAACTGKFFIHKLACTDERLLLSAKAMDMTLIDVNQGYTKCSVAVVDEKSIITYDEGIAKSCSRYHNLDVLKISPGFVRLDGYDTGFIGGTCGRVGNQIVFNGNLSQHPDYRRIEQFIQSKGLSCKWFCEYSLTDIGSIL